MLCITHLLFVLNALVKFTPSSQNFDLKIVNLLSNVKQRGKKKDRDHMSKYNYGNTRSLFKQKENSFILHSKDYQTFENEDLRHFLIIGKIHRLRRIKIVQEQILH